MLAVHLAIVVFVVGGLVLVAAGNLRGWRWVNAWWFRLAHLAAIGVVVAESWLGITCPLTTLESWLRAQGGEAGYRQGFIADWLQRLLFYDAPPWVFGLAYSLFGALVAAAWWYFPPRPAGHTIRMHRDPSVVRAAKLPLWAAMFAVVALGLTTLVAAALTPGYSHVSQFISELGAEGAPLQGPVRYLGFPLAGLALLVFCGTAWRQLPASGAATFGLLGLAVYAGGYLVAVVFPCDPGCRPATPSLSQQIHNLVGLLGYLLAPGFLVLLGRAARHWPGARHLVLASHVAAGVALLGLLTLSPASPVVGLSQRALEAAVLAWAVCCGAYIAARPVMAHRAD